MNELICTGLNHNTAPLDVREMVALTSKGKIEAAQKFKDYEEISGCAVLGTCNRLEIYMSSDDPETSLERAEDFLHSEASRADYLQDALYRCRGEKAAEHIFRVACGGDSMIKGEPQILNQVKEAYNTAEEHGCCDTHLHEVFNRALRTGKRARTETEISENAASVGYAAVEIARQELKALEKSSMLIVGAGEMGRAVMKNMLERGVQSPTIANRSYERSAKLADRVGGKAIEIDELPRMLDHFDIVIGCTAAPHYVIWRDKHGEIIDERDKSQLMIDLAVPRDIDPELEELSHVSLYMIDDLEEVVDSGLEERSRALAQVEEIIAEEKENYICWRRERQAVPLIKAMQEKGEEIRLEELERAIERIEEVRGEISRCERQVLEDLTSQIVKKLLHHPMIQTKKMIEQNGSCETSGDLFETVSRLFALEVQEDSWQ
ncbi:glutamyl-tRNA reductase [Halarsenatibacter silvermanii]|uniref:Glutamyl-tRNA reductase n=1 Tax=Halarsenatibacter silvermanii TaxID=321763 RepID=A0A1G9Q1W4_9FIRM|nr:glutamyl-tRNA reductase [Halarsenatibacter silvermanii]SDM05042.1 glutamyl-tRNA reductase [Halarsenatibacter silvermanii]